MKTIKLFVIAFLFFAGNLAHAQVAVDVNVSTPNVNVHVGTPPPPPPPSRPAPPPVWGPVGYDEVEYYYLPDIEVYYDIRLTQYIYFGNGKWIRSRYLPSRCRNYDLYNGYKVVLNDYHGHSPYTYFHDHKVKYYKGYKGKPQKARGPYKVQYEDDHHDHHDNYNHGDHGNNKHDNHGNHGKHEGKGHSGKGKH